MNHKQQTYCLALHPRAVNFPLTNIDGLRRYLQVLGLWGETFSFNGEQRYMLGERFYQLLTFMGCAPALKLEPDAPGDDKFCHFRFFESPHLEFRYLRPEVKARCPHCKKAGTAAQEVYQGYILKHLDWPCPHCRQSFSPQDINWKHEAGMGRFFIELLDIHPHEVVPTDSLLKELATMTGHSWGYYYTTIECHKIIT